MSLLLSCQHLSKSYGPRVLFEDLSFSVFSGERIGLIGPNGAGKSTLLKILASLEKSEEGSITARKELRIGYVPQMHEFPSILPFKLLLQGLEENQELQDYEKELQVEIWLSKLGFDEHRATLSSQLSGGWKKRLAIAIALLKKPELLLLDEPTNHLDLEGILWLEKFLKREAPTFVVISHDRDFLDHLMTRVVEINPLYPKGIFSVDGPYSQFLEKKELFIEGQLEQERSVAGKARRELDWVRRSPKARTTKSQARIDAAEEIFKQHQDLKLRNKVKVAGITFEASERQTRQLITLKSIKATMGERLLFEGIDLTLSPGTRLGLMGPNGSGKTTFLKLLAKELDPAAGTIKWAQDLKIVYFDQYRNKLPLKTTLKEALSPEGDYVYYQGKDIHVSGFAKRFLFSSDLLEMPIEKLSGGERARIAIARLMLTPADVLLLDEPTNDLDISTLEILEDSLKEFSGAVVLITHDRRMLSELCSQFLILGNPHQPSIQASIEHWEQLFSKPSVVLEKDKKADVKKQETKKGLSYKEKKELETIEKTIESKEKKIEELKKELSSQDLAKNLPKLDALCRNIDAEEKELATLYERWHQLLSS